MMKILKKKSAGNKKTFKVYRNLHKGNFSIQSYKPEKKGYRVTDRCSTMLLVDCKLSVSQYGRNKVLEEKRKNVHAFVKPNSFMELSEQLNVENMREIYYNPYKFDSFVYKDTGVKVENVKHIIAQDNKLYDGSNTLEIKTILDI